MTSKKQQAANRKNALRSTGPKSTSGKSKSARNAQSHSLTKPPELGSVLNWFRVILNDNRASPVIAHMNERLQAAYRLAEAEAYLQKVRAAEVHLYLSILKEEAELVPLNKLSAETIQSNSKDAKKISSILSKLTGSVKAEGVGKIRLMNRYLSEAESARSSALGVWIKMC